MSYQRAIDIEENSRRCDLLGASLASLGLWPEAEAAFRRGVALGPNDSDVKVNLAAAVANLGRFGEATELLEEFLRRDPGERQD